MWVLSHRCPKIKPGCKGYLTLADIESIPGMSDNPLSSRIARAMAKEGHDREDHHGDDQDEIRITFRSFCKSFSHFKAEEEDEETAEADGNLEEDKKKKKKKKKRAKAGNPKGKLE